MNRPWAPDTVPTPSQHDAVKSVDAVLQGPHRATLELTGGRGQGGIRRERQVRLVPALVGGPIRVACPQAPSVSERQNDPQRTCVHEAHGVACVEGPCVTGHSRFRTPTTDACAATLIHGQSDTRNRIRSIWAGQHLSVECMEADAWQQSYVLRVR